MADTHQQTIESEFAKQAQDFGQEGLTLSSEELLTWAVDNLPHSPDAAALDIATGTGHLARSLAAHVAHITGIDATPEMLAQGVVAAGDAGLANIDFVRGLAEQLPFPNNTFDLTVCRLAIHHYQEPARHVAEMARVCKTGGTVAIVDLIAPDDALLAEAYNHYERLRDPSHAKALSLDELVVLLEAQNVSTGDIAWHEVVVVVDAWLALTRTPQDRVQIVRQALYAELDGGAATGMRPFVEDDEIKFVQSWVMVSGMKFR